MQGQSGVPGESHCPLQSLLKVVELGLQGGLHRPVGLHQSTCCNWDMSSACVWLSEVVCHRDAGGGMSPQPHFGGHMVVRFEISPQPHFSGHTVVRFGMLPQPHFGGCMVVRFEMSPQPHFGGHMVVRFGMSPQPHFVGDVVVRFGMLP